MNPVSFALFEFVTGYLQLTIRLNVTRIPIQWSGAPIYRPSANPAEAGAEAERVAEALRATIPPIYAGVRFLYYFVTHSSIILAPFHRELRLALIRKGLLDNINDTRYSIVTPSLDGFTMTFVTNYEDSFGHGSHPLEMDGYFNHPDSIDLHDLLLSRSAEDSTSFDRVTRVAEPSAIYHGMIQVETLSVICSEYQERLRCKRDYEKQMQTNFKALRSRFYSSDLYFGFSPGRNGLIPICIFLFSSEEEYRASPFNGMHLNDIYGNPIRFDEVHSGAVIIETGKLLLSAESELIFSIPRGRYTALVGYSNQHTIEGNLCITGDDFYTIILIGSTQKIIMRSTKNSTSLINQSALHANKKVSKGSIMTSQELG